MSGANAIHGVILIGAILVAGQADSTPMLVLGLVAVVLAAINMVGGFVVTDRMLFMFSGRRAVAPSKPSGARAVSYPIWRRSATWSPRSASSSPSRACPRRGRRAAAI